jgi:hypothetical protein
MKGLHLVTLPYALFGIQMMALHESNTAGGTLAAAFANPIF